MLAAVNQRGERWKSYFKRLCVFASEWLKVKGDKEVVLAAVNQHGEALEFASEEMKGDKEVVLAAVNVFGFALRHASEELKGDKEVVLAAVNRHGRALQFSSDELKGDKEVVLAAVKKNGWALRHAFEELKGDKEVVLTAVNQHGEELRHASQELKGDKEMVLAAVNQSGKALEFASDELKGDKEVVLVAVNQHEEALVYALPTLRNGGLQAYVAGLLNAHTVPCSVFLGTILCGTKTRTSLTLDVEDSFSRPVVKGANGETGGTLVVLPSRDEAIRVCLLPKLDLGDETTIILMKMIAAFAGVRCQEFFKVRWSHVVTVAQKIGVGVKVGQKLH